MTFLYLLGLAIAQGRNARPSSRGSERDGETNTQRINGRTRWRDPFLTFLYCGCFFCFGTTMAILGPTLIELGHLVHHGLDMMSWLFFTQSSYALLGASMAGIILDRYVHMLHWPMSKKLTFRGSRASAASVSIAWNIKIFHRSSPRGFLDFGFFFFVGFNCFEKEKETVAGIPTLQIDPTSRDTL